MTISDRHHSAFEHRFQASGSAGMALARQLIFVLLTATSYVAYFRSTGMGYGYPSYQDQMSGADYGMLAVLNYCLAALGIIYILVDGPFLIRLAMRSPALLFGLLLVLVTIVGAEDPVYSLRVFLAVFFITLPIVAFAARFGTARALDLLRRFCVAAICLNVFYIAVFPQYAIMGGDAGFRGMFSHKNGFGPFMAVAFVVLFPSGKRSAVDNLLATAACLLAFAFVVLSRSASAWVMLMVAPILYIGLRLVLLGRDRTTRSIVVAAVALSACAAVIFGYLYLFDALLSLLGRDATLTGRTKLWGVLVDVIWEYPYFGHGFAAFSRPDAFTKYWDEFGWSAGSAHNSYLEVLLNFGFVVSTYWVFILLKTARANLVSYREMLPADIVKQQIITIMILLSAFSQAGHFFSAAFVWLALIMSLFHDSTHNSGVKRPRKLTAANRFRRDVVLGDVASAREPRDAWRRTVPRQL